MRTAGGDPDCDAAHIVGSITDPERFTVIFSRHVDQLYRYIARQTHPSAVDDLVAETFCVAFRSRAKYNVDYSDASPWLYGLARGVLSNHRKSEHRRRIMLGRHQGTHSSDAAAATGSDHGISDQAEELRQALSELDPKYADPLILLFDPGFTYEEISRILRIPIGTVRSRIARGKTKLRDQLTASQPQPSNGLPIMTTREIL